MKYALVFDFDAQDDWVYIGNLLKNTEVCRTEKEIQSNNTTIMTTKTICRGGQNYVSPVLEVLDFKAEGILCASGEGSVTINDWERDDASIDF